MPQLGNIGPRYIYSTMNQGQDLDYTRVICRDCTTRSTLVVIPADEMDDHDHAHEESR